MHADVTKLATERVLKARSELILARRFYGVLVSQVEPVASSKFPTMATNGRQHYFNPQFVCGLTQEELLGVQAHESEHDARHHGTRRNGRDPEQWNIACDYAINIDLIDEGFKLPKGALIDAKYRGMSAEDIYRCRELDRQREEQAKQQEEQEEQEEDNDHGDCNDDEEGDSGDEQQEEDDGEEGSQGEAGEDGNEEGEQGEPGDAGADGDDSVESEDGGDAGEGSDQPGQGSGEGADAQGDMGEGDANAGSGDADGEAEGEEVQSSSGDPGQCGEVLDTVADEDGGDVDADVEDSKWERVIRQAASMAKAVGQLPGHVQSIIDKANNPQQDWREILRQWIDEGARRIETWNRPNRRFAGGGLYMPSSQKDGVNHVVAIFDTSASCDDIALALVGTETQAALDDGAINKLTVIQCDTRVTDVKEYGEGDEIDFDFKGRGGTMLRPAFEHAREHCPDASLIICFTDMENYDWGDEPQCPVLFAAHGYPDRVREYLASAPWGSPGIDVGAH